MNTFVTIVFVIVSLVMVLAILLQAGKGGGMGTALGGTASQGVFGGGGQADFMAKLTQGFAATFMITAMYLAYASAHAGSEFLESEDQGGKSMLNEDQEFNPEMIGYHPLVLPTEEEAKRKQLAASLAVPAQTPVEPAAAVPVEAPVEAPTNAPVEAPANVDNAQGDARGDSPQAGESDLQNTAPVEPTSMNREASPAAPADAP